MKALIRVLPALLFSLVLGVGQPVWAESEPGYIQMSDEYQEELLAPEELEELLAPIALYPDPLIAQILPAATFVDQVQAAADFVRRYGTTLRIDDQPWDVSVRAIAHYPDVLYMMDEKYEWTVALGQAFVNQQQDVMDAIQSLRLEARERGNLYTTGEQHVVYEEDLVRIVPARPEYIYVPVYDPQVVYVERYNPTYPFITFGLGLSIGAWLNRDCDWRQRRVYYHGWRGDGWVHRSRPYARDRRGVYVNRRASVVQVNNRVLQHDSRRIRQELRNDSWRIREQRGLTAPGKVISRPGSSRIERIPGRVEQRTPGRIERRGPATIIRQGAGSTGQTRSGGASQRRPGGAVQVPPTTIKAPPPSVKQPPPSVKQPPASVVQPPAPVVQPPSSPMVQPRRSRGFSPPTVVPPAAITTPAPSVAPSPSGIRERPSGPGSGGSGRSGRHMQQRR